MAACKATIKLCGEDLEVGLQLISILIVRIPPDKKLSE